MLEGQTATYNIRCFEKNQLDLVADIATTAQVSDPTSSHPKETAVSWMLVSSLKTGALWKLVA